MARRLLRALKMCGLLGGLGKQIRSAHLYVRAPSPLLQRASLSARVSSPRDAPSEDGGQELSPFPPEDARESEAQARCRIRR
eukprot:5688708-Lingulodinium_polyedra.AAC.1